MTDGRLVGYTLEDDIATISINNPPVNALSAAVRAGLMDALREAEADPGATAIVLTAEGRTFIAGADITEFGKPPVAPVLPEVVSAFEQSRKPVVAAINGAALGGGLEVAMGCHARVAVPTAKLGLPEVKLGLLPGAGGTQRLPRLVGGEAALKLITDGTPISVWDAKNLGLVDEIANGDLRAEAKLKAKALAGALPSRSCAAARLGSRAAFEAAATALQRRGPDPAALAAIEAVRAAYDLPFEAGIALEWAQFLRLREDPRSRALRHVFFAERQVTRIAGLPDGTSPRTVERVAVIGAGTMGGGIAMCFANAGVPLTLIETGEDALQRGLARIIETYNGSVKRGSLTPEQRTERLALIEPRVGLETAVGADLIVEAVFEDMALKTEIFSRLGAIAKPGAILATNTSYLDVNEIAAATRRPQDVLGMHFFSPAPVMRLVEVVRGARTAPDALVGVVQTCTRLGKLPVVVGVCYGFVGNRMLAARSGQLERLLLEGALPQDIDSAIIGFGFRMGPCAMADLAGLDIGWRLRQSTGKRARIADALCETGRYGQKSGKGYYFYDEDGRTPRPDPEVALLLERLSAEFGVTRRSIGAAEIIERLLYPLINEGARILEEGIASRPGDIDIVWINGYGWPAWRGGPMYHAGQVGLAAITGRLSQIADATGDESLRPSALLQRLAAEGSAFAALGGTEAPS